MHIDDNTPNGWNAVWKRKDLFISIIDTGREFYNLFFKRLMASRLKNNDEMIELGCGSASTLSLSIAKKLKKYVGIDTSQEALLIARKITHSKKIMNAEFIEADIFNLPKNLHNRFDLVWSQGLMEHFPDYLPVVEAHYQVIKPGGTMLLGVPWKYSYINIWSWATKNKWLARFWPYAEQKFLTHKELRELGEKIGAPYRAYIIPPFYIGFILGVLFLEIKKPHETLTGSLIA